MAASFALPLNLSSDHGSTGGERSPRPTLYVVQGGRTGASSPVARSSAAATTPRRVFIVRRIGVALAAAALAAMLVVTVLGLVGSAAGSQAVPGASDIGVHTIDRYEVLPGDTLWSIAGSLGIDADRRGVVEALIDANGSGVLQPGDELVIPAALARHS